MTFDQWLNETENNRSRLEKAYQELVLDRYNDNNSFWKTILVWLKTSYSIGYTAGKNEILSLANSLKNEIKTQRKEIAGLRESQRLLLDKDKVPEIGWRE